MTNEKKKIWGWSLYDWAAQPYSTLLLTFIFGPFFASAIASDPVSGQAMWGAMLSIVGIILMFAGPISGAVADTTGPRKPWILFYSVFYVIGAFGLWWAIPSVTDPVTVLIVFGIGLLGMEMTQVFVNAMLPDMGPKSNLGRISGNAWALGYVGGLVLLFVVLLLFAENEEGKTLLGNAPILGLDAATREGTRAVGPLTAIWYLVFMIPFFLWVPEKPSPKKVTGVVGKALRDLWATLKTLPNNLSLASYLVSSMFYRDALIALYSFGGIYAVGVLDWTVPQIGIFGIVGGIAAAVGTYLGGFADKNLGSKRVIIWCVVILIFVSMIIIGTSRTTFFGAALSEGSTFPDKMLYIMGAILGAAGGILQSASRTMLVSQANEDRMTEAFGLYALAGRATAWLAPGLISMFTYITASQRLGFAPVIVLFIISLFLLVWVRDNRS